jgi:excisionase family DNA binding protein
MSGKDEFAMTTTRFPVIVTNPDVATHIPPILTIPDVAHLMKVHHTTVRGLIHSRELRARKVGAQWRISADALREYMGDGAPQ